MCIFLSSTPLLPTNCQFVTQAVTDEDIIISAARQQNIKVQKFGETCEENPADRATHKSRSSAESQGGENKQFQADVAARKGILPRYYLQ